MGKYQIIKKLCEENDVTISKLERDLKFSRGSISKIDEHKPSMDRIAKIAMYFNVSPMTLLVDEDSTEEEWAEADAMQSVINKMPPVTVETPVTHSCYEVAAGDSKYPIEDEFKQEDGNFARVVGDSMYPVLHDGDIVRIVEATDLKLKDIVLVKINGDENTLKYAEVLPDGIWISAENKDVFKDRFFTMEMVLTLPVQIVGKAVEIVSRKL